MKILATTFLSVIFLFQSSGPVTDWCCELLKIPNLVEHYKEQSADTGITFFDFIDYHYGDQKKFPGHEKDNHDGELPLQGNHSCYHGMAYVDSPNLETYSLGIPEAKTNSLFYQPPFSSASLGTIFQPPQV
ncbi:hypothetical protein HC174_12245 [Salinimicrobium sp. CDJ15-81-2]|uniref:Uncharacterized protein n=2 Tax=Flavobacteriaceae TaxID=49546 RepID=A0ABU3CL40_9FLAO|nr:MULTISPECIES: hypothetical protein [Flavobacteriaceae]MDT0647079.1 hypothetical protein [Zunongwangia sp. F260]NJW52158.1 hypothetical protein [Salinimicrobium oceani]NJY63517.1 hypothetical protein [Salinimicrobium nanhaiense]